MKCHHLGLVEFRRSGDPFRRNADPDGKSQTSPSTPLTGVERGYTRGLFCLIVLGYGIGRWETKNLARVVTRFPRVRPKVEFRPLSPETLLVSN